MEKKLTRLLDYQRFAQNSRLSGIIADVESRYAGALADDDLALVSAAGDTNPPQEEWEELTVIFPYIQPEREKT